MKLSVYRSAACLSIMVASLLCVACAEDDDCKPGTICTIAGTGASRFDGDGKGGTDTSLYLPVDVTPGPDGRLYIVDWNNHRIRALTREGTVATVAGSGGLGDVFDGPALEVRLSHPTQVIFDQQGRMVIAAWDNSRIKRLDFATGLIENIVGTGGRAYAGDGGPALEAILHLPVSVAHDPDSNLLFMDHLNQVIRRVGADDIIETFAGRCVISECADGEEPADCPDSNDKSLCGPYDPARCNDACRPGFAGDGGPATELRMSQPDASTEEPAGHIAVDAQGAVYFADPGNHRVRRIGPDGVVTTVAGNGTQGFAGDGGPAVSARLSSPRDVEIDSNGTLYIADTQSSCVRAVSADGLITTVAGICGQHGFDGDGGDATLALLDHPYGIALDREDNLYVADTRNHRIRLVHR